MSELDLGWLPARLVELEIPGVSIAVLRPDSIETHVAGYADIASKRPMTPDTLLQAG